MNNKTTIEHMLSKLNNRLDFLSTNIDDSKDELLGILEFVQEYNLTVSDELYAQLKLLNFRGKLSTEQYEEAIEEKEVLLKALNIVNYLEALS